MASGAAKEVHSAELAFNAASVQILKTSVFAGLTMSIENLFVVSR
jgi:hypothetical protein